MFGKEFTITEITIQGFSMSKLLPKITQSLQLKTLTQIQRIWDLVYTTILLSLT